MQSPSIKFMQFRLFGIGGQVHEIRFEFGLAFFFFYLFYSKYNYNFINF